LTAGSNGPDDAAWSHSSSSPKTITEQRSRVEAALRNGLSNARVEQVNTGIRLITRRGFGYHSPDAVIALAMLTLGGFCPPLPGR
jgi:transposase